MNRTGDGEVDTGDGPATDGGIEPNSSDEDVPESDRSFDGGLRSLLDRNRSWTDALPEEHFEGLRETQAPAVTSMCCSDSRVSQDGMFCAPTEAGFLFTPSNIGNTVVTVVDGERAVDGSFLYGLATLDSPSGAVVGHTGCGAVTAAYRAATGEDVDEPPGIVEELEVLVEIVEEALADSAIDTDLRESAIVNQLVEYNVDAQIDFLRESGEVSGEKALYGFVYDFQRAYGDVDGRTVLVNLDGETDPDALHEAVPDGYEAFVGRLLR